MPTWIFRVFLGCWIRKNMLANLPSFPSGWNPTWPPKWPPFRRTCIKCEFAPSWDLSKPTFLGSCLPPFSDKKMCPSNFHGESKFFGGFSKWPPAVRLISYSCHISNSNWSIVLSEASIYMFVASWNTMESFSEWSDLT